MGRLSAPHASPASLATHDEGGSVRQMSFHCSLVLSRLKQHYVTILPSVNSCSMVQCLVSCSFPHSVALMRSQAIVLLV